MLIKKYLSILVIILVMLCAQSITTYGEESFFKEQTQDFFDLYSPPYHFNFLQGAGVLLITTGLAGIDEDIYQSSQDFIAGTYFKEKLTPVLDDWALPVFVAYGIFRPEDNVYKQINLQAVAFAGINVEVVKRLIGGSRPVTGEEDFIGPTLRENYDAMPSSHTAIAFALATVLAKEDPERKWFYYGTALAIGFLRVADERHWPSNIFAGAAVGYWCGERVWEKQNPLQLTLKF